MPPPENVPDNLKAALNRLQVAADSLRFSVRAGKPGPWPAVDAETGDLGVLLVLDRDDGQSGVEFTTTNEDEGLVTHHPYRPIPDGRFLVGQDAELWLLRRVAIALDGWVETLGEAATLSDVDAYCARLNAVLEARKLLQAWRAIRV